MSRVKDLKRQLDAGWDAIEGLDADLSTGRLDAEEHARQRAEREREIGRLFVSLRRAQRQALEREADEEGDARREPAAMPGWLRNPVVLVAMGVVLLAAGIGGGVAVSRRFSGGTPSPGASTTAPVESLSSGITPSELEALRQAAMREDAPIAGMLQYAHIMLEQGKLDDARRVYEKVLGREPKNAEAITHVGAVLYQQGQVDQGLAKVEEALRVEPRYIHALWDRVLYLHDAKKDYPAVVKAAEAFLAFVPEGPDADNMRKILAEARQRAPVAPSATKSR